MYYYPACRKALPAHRVVRDCTEEQNGQTQAVEKDWGQEEDMAGAEPTSQLSRGFP